MKKSLFIFCPLLFGSISMMLGNSNDKASVAKQAAAAVTTNIMSCAPSAEDDFYLDETGKFISILPGWGNHSYNITTHSDSAQMYFNQGLSMYYSYHAREAIASFKEAARFDSSCAMAYWGQALAMGPSYNGGFAYKMNKEVPAVINKMNRTAEQASAKEKDFIGAMLMRYYVTDTTDKQRKELNGYCAEAMKPLAIKYPDDLDIKALYTDAVMLIHAWDFWNNDGTPKPWTTELVQNCEDILKKDPHHPGALHYYIHTTEASRKPEVALASADSLIKLFPGVAHMVHMSSHEYERIGHYAKGVDANEKADASLVLYYSLASGLYPRVHIPHYYSVDAYCALSGAMYKKGLQKSLTCRNSLGSANLDNYQQYLYMLPLFTMVRMGKWQAILKDTSNINPQWIYASLLNDFAKGMAYAKANDFVQAEKELNQLLEKRDEDVLKAKFAPNMSSPYEGAVIAENILRATILFNKKKYPESISFIKKAIHAEDSLLYTEPKLWMLPARQYLGASLLKLNKPKEAEEVYREDLVWNPGNGWSLLGLYQSLKAQQKNGELAKVKALYIQSFSDADTMPPGSVY